MLAKSPQLPKLAVTPLLAAQRAAAAGGSFKVEEARCRSSLGIRSDPVALTHGCRAAPARGVLVLEAHTPEPVPAGSLTSYGTQTAIDPVQSLTIV